MLAGGDRRRRRSLVPGIGAKLTGAGTLQPRRDPELLGLYTAPTHLSSPLSAPRVLGFALVVTLRLHAGLAGGDVTDR